MALCGEKIGIRILRASSADSHSSSADGRRLKHLQNPGGNQHSELHLRGCALPWEARCARSPVCHVRTAQSPPKGSCAQEGPALGFRVSGFPRGFQLFPRVLRIRSQQTGSHQRTLCRSARAGEAVQERTGSQGARALKVCANAAWDEHPDSQGCHPKSGRLTTTLTQGPKQVKKTFLHNYGCNFGGLKGDSFASVPLFSSPSKIAHLSSGFSRGVSGHFSSTDSIPPGSDPDTCSAALVL